MRLTSYTKQPTVWFFWQLGYWKVLFLSSIRLLQSDLISHFNIIKISHWQASIDILFRFCSFSQSARLHEDICVLGWVRSFSFMRVIIQRRPASMMQTLSYIFAASIIGSWLVCLLLCSLPWPPICLVLLRLILEYGHSAGGGGGARRLKKN